MYSWFSDWCDCCRVFRSLLMQHFSIAQLDISYVLATALAVFVMSLLAVLAPQNGLRISHRALQLEPFSSPNYATLD